MKRKILSVLLALCMLTAFVPCVASAAVVDSGECGANLTWTLDDAGTLTISGEGEMEDYSYYSHSPWYDNSSITNVVIEQGVKSIGASAFSGCYHLTSITIPDSVTSIGASAFSNCYRLTNITIPDSVTSIGEGAFYFCTGLTSVTIPDSVTSIAEQTFYRCGLTSVTIGNGVTNIGERAFFQCGNLINVKIPDSVTSIDSYAFYGCGSCLTSVEIGSGVTSIGISAFSYCGSLNITVSTSNPNYSDIDGVLFNKDKTEIIKYTKDQIQSEYSIPNNVISISEGAFFSCGNLTSVTIPNSVTSIGEEAFSDCGSLNISVDGNNTSFCDINGVLFNKNKSEIIAYSKDKIQADYTIPDSVTSIGERAFSYCENLSSVTIGSNVKSIGNSAFEDCINLTSITIPDNVTSIGNSAFYLCKGLKSVTIGSGVTSIGERAFFQCRGLTDIYYGGTETMWQAITVKDSNEPLMNAQKHYNSDGPILPLKVEPIVPILDAANNSVSFPVTVTEPERAEELNDVELYVAEYDENGRFIGLTLGTKSEVEGDTITINAEVPTAKYKLMLWDGNNVPLMDAVEDITEIQ